MPEPDHTEAGLREKAQQLRGRLEGAASSASYGYPRDPDRWAALTDLLLDAASALDSLLHDTPGACSDCGWPPSPTPSVGEYLRACENPCHRKPASSTPEGEKRCGGSGYLRKRPSAANGLTSYPCPGCPDCRPCTRCEGDGIVFDYTDPHPTEEPCPRCHGTGVEPPSPPDLHTGDEESHKNLAGTDEGENVSPSRDALPAAPSSQHPEQSEEPRRWTIYDIREASGEELEAAFGEPDCEVVEARELERVTLKLFEKQEAARRYREEADAALARIESLTTTIQAALDVPDNTEVGTGAGRESITYVTPRHARAVLIETRKLLRSALADQEER